MKTQEGGEVVPHVKTQEEGEVVPHVKTQEGGEFVPHVKTQEGGEVVPHLKTQEGVGEEEYEQRVLSWSWSMHVSDEDRREQEEL